MRVITNVSRHLKQIVAVSGGLALFIFTFHCFGCAKPQTGVAQYVFTYQNEEYRIRTIQSTAQKVSYNEVIGANFVAADIDQDRILDQIVAGDISLSEAQKVYDYGLSKLSDSKKLEVTAPTSRQYYRENTDCDYALKSFRPMNAEPFNEFKIIDKKSGTANISIYLDKKADGVLDHTLKGKDLSQDIQNEYSNLLAAGIAEGKIIQNEYTIMVKE